MKDLITIIIPLYNSEKTIERCLESIINQTYNNLEILIINDGSIDNSKTICERFLNLDNRIKVVNIENHGVSYARNLGIKLSNGKYISFIDADDRIDKDMIYILYKNLIKYKADLSICGYEKIFNNAFNNESDIKYELHIFDKLTTIKEFVLDRTFGGSVWNKLFVKEICKNIRFNEEIKYNEDRLYLYNYINLIKKSVYSEKKLYYYYINSNSATNNKKNISKMFQMIEINKQINKSIYESYNTLENEIFYNELKLNINFYRFLTFSSNYFSYRKEKEEIRNEIRRLSNIKFDENLPKVMMLEINILNISKVLYFIIIKIANNRFFRKIRRKLI